MIIFHLDKLLKDIGISRLRFAKQSGVRPNTINDICNQKSKRIEMHTLVLILSTLNSLNEQEVTLQDLMEYKRK